MTIEPDPGKTAKAPPNLTLKNIYIKCVPDQLIYGNRQ